MSRKRPVLPLLPQVEIADIAEEGKGLGRADGMVVFVEKAVPGDVADVQVFRKKKKFAEGKIAALIQPSPDRTDAFCSHFGVCGGCKWQHMSYGAQLRWKQKTVVDALERIGGIDTGSIETILGSAHSQYYRNKLEYTFSNQRWLLAGENESGEIADRNALGFHVPLRFDKILDIQHCYLQADPSNAIRLSVKAFATENDYTFYDLRQHEGELRNLIIRTASTGELMVIVVFAYTDQQRIDALMGMLQQRFPEITSLLYIVNQKRNDTIFDQDIRVFAGRDHIFEEMSGAFFTGKNIRFKIGPKSFYQTNSLQAAELYRITAEFAGLKGDEHVYDLYTGAGTIANYIAGKARKVTGIEYVPAAIEDAHVNSELNGITNTTFFAGDMKDVLNADFINEQGKPDVVITDPPRAGMHADVVARLLEMEAPKIVYVSCNPATQARDLALLNEKYVVKRIRPVDMFPHTQHVENVVLLEKRG
ncbi:MAG: 23S rRNA (uracil(1939)-C(5))-methyltransferase RlmD [Mucilaginibacter polytrichastri]|nr:23S rRNA (uracil(1939)-C(5))-methyltransferase RlmD [Mucilaginibacter polytrichastri]